MDNDDFKLKLISQKIKQDKNNNTIVLKKVYQNIEIHTLFNFDHTFPYFCYVAMISLDHKIKKNTILKFSKAMINSTEKIRSFLICIIFIGFTLPEHF